MKWYQWITARVWFHYQYSINHVTVIKSYLMKKNNIIQTKPNNLIGVWKMLSGKHWTLNIIKHNVSSYFNLLYIFIQVFEDHQWMHIPSWALGPSNHLSQCWHIVDWTLRNKHQWDFNLNRKIFTEENAFEKVICKMFVFSSQWQKNTWNQAKI